MLLSHLSLSGAEDEVRTRDPQLGKLMLYQLSYFRLFFQRCKDNVFPVTNKSSGDFIICFLLPMLDGEDDVVFNT